MLLFIPVFIISLSIHEFAHAWVADKLGDSTARYLGRLTMDPMAHISWFGTVIFPALMVLTGGPLFGWANPVPIDMRNFKRPRPYMALVAIAGPISNIILAILCAGGVSLIARHSAGANIAMANGTKVGMSYAAIEMLAQAVYLNLFLAFFNLIPLPPLDGSRVLQAVVSETTAQKIEGLANYAQLVLLLLFFTGGLQYLARPVIAFAQFLFLSFGISGL
jgi:Zn-dependent protease